MNIYVGNLSYQVTEEELSEIFEQFGQVASVNIIKDRYSGQSKGFGFVEMESKSESDTAIEQLNGSLIKGRNVKVNKARQRTERSTSRSKPY